jgi:hypothetical protein
MAKEKNPKKPDDEDRPKHKPEGREHQVHKEILERRWKGGPEPKPEDFERALEQWKKLPGAIIRPPTDVTPPPFDEPSKPEDEGSPTNQKPEDVEKSDREDKP